MLQVDAVQTANPDNLVTMQCVFWDEALDDGFGKWSNQGCRLVDDSGDVGETKRNILCECNHLSSFTVIAVSVMISL